jgi:hypothetical protein
MLADIELIQVKLHMLPFSFALREQKRMDCIFHHKTERKKNDV